MLKKLGLLIVFMIGLQGGISTAESLESLQKILNLNHGIKNNREHKNMNLEKKRNSGQKRTHNKMHPNDKNAPHRNRHRADKWN